MYITDNHALMPRFLRVCIGLLLTITPWAIDAQDYGWWNTLVQWDGRSHWSEYMIYTPKYFGPNAIPIPEVKNGKIINQTEIEIGFATHFSDGDDTQNLTTRIYIPVTKDRIGLQLNVVPYERYKMTPETRDVRRARDFDGQGYALGDIYIGTWIQLTKPTSEVDLLLTLNIKTASGSNREATRYTDGSGYNFDLSAGKSFQKKGKVNYIRPYAQIGFYVWETNEDRNPQNDAFSYGVGADMAFQKSTLTTQIAGFAGYKGNGDKPIIARLSYGYQFSSKISIKLSTQYGSSDYPYRSIFLSVNRSW